LFLGFAKNFSEGDGLQNENERNSYFKKVFYFLKLPQIPFLISRYKKANL